MSRPLPRSSRRAALGWGLAVAVTGSGCSAIGTPQEQSPASGAPVPPRDPATGDERPAPPEAPDAELVARIRNELSKAHARVRANRRAHPSLAQALRTTERLHARHASELGGLVAVRAASGKAEKRRTLVLPRLRADEARLQQLLVRASVAAESGALALLLAAMAAGVAQERSRL